MKAKIIVSLLLAIFLAGPVTVMAQDRNEKKINRLMRKIEKQNRKLEKLNGGEFHAFAQVAPLADMEEQMSLFRENNSEKMDQIKAKREIEMEVLKNINGKKFHVPEFNGGGYSFFSDEDALEIQKDLAGETISADFNYEVKKDATGMNLNVNGSIDSGKVVITIKKPDGSVFNEYILSPLANVNWHQTLKFEGEEESAYIGKWTVTVAGENAKGKYSVHLNGR